jgi:hypothetical protein
MAMHAMEMISKAKRWVNPKSEQTKPVVAKRRIEKVKPKEVGVVVVAVAFQKKPKQESQNE